MEREVDIAIVGAGPAGLAAALECAEAGAQTVLIDEYHTLGGQYHKQAPEAFKIRNLKAEGEQYYEGAELIQKLRQTGVEVMADTLVWGIFEGRSVALYREDRSELLRPKALILAPGGQERPIAFPGWTLPGVMLGGAIQAMLVNQRVLPGRRVVLAGVGPMQLRIGSQLLDAGVEIVDMLEASSKPPVSMEHALRSLGHWGKMRQGMEYWMKLTRARTPYHHSTVPVRAHGQEELEAVTVAQVDEEWRVIPGTERTLEADTLCLTYGFVPSNQLPRLAGCQAAYDELAGGWVTTHDADQQTSVPGVYVAGEVGGIGGADVAEEEGRLAAIAAARAVGSLKADGRRSQEDRARKRLDEAKKFAAMTNEMMSVKPALFDLITDDTVMCRCEWVTAAQIAEAVADGDPTVKGVKMRTRAGMGLCQGRTCGFLVSQLIAKQTGTPLSSLEPDTPRPPVKPVPLRALAAGAE